MKKRNFLKPVALLAAGLSSSISASNVNLLTELSESEHNYQTKTQLLHSDVSKGNNVLFEDFIIQPSSALVQMAGHYSHSSHASHSSHSSHASSSY